MQGYTNPVIDSDNPDPGVLYIPEADLYLAVTTHGEDGASFPLLTSADLATWEHKGWVFPPGSRPEYCASSMWAPEIHCVNGRSSGEIMRRYQVTFQIPSIFLLHLPKWAPLCRRGSVSD